jgi:hypothetical protein
LAQKPSAKALPRAALGKEPLGNFESAKRSLPRTLYRAHGKAFAEGKKTLGKENPRQNINRKKQKKNSKIIFFGRTDEPSLPLAGFFVAFYTVFLTLWSVGFKLVISHALSHLPPITTSTLYHLYLYSISIPHML